MKKQNRRGWYVLLVGVGMMCLFVGMSFGPTRVEIKQSKPQIQKVYDVDIRTKTVEVPRPFSYDCKRFLEATFKLRDAQRILSQTKGEMETMVQEITKNVGNQDATGVVRLKKKMIVLTDTMDNAWHDIGDAASVLDKYSADDNPC